MEHGTNRESDEPMYLHVAYVLPIYREQNLLSY